MENDLIAYVGNKGIIENGKGEVLIIKETHSMNWELPGGKIQNTEIESKLQDCLARELAEELGQDFKFQILDIADTMFRTFDKPRNPLVTKVFLVVWNVKYLGGEINHQAEEVLDHAWITKDTCENYEYVNGYKKVLDKYFTK